MLKIDQKLVKNLKVQIKIDKKLAKELNFCLNFTENTRIEIFAKITNKQLALASRDVGCP